ncbi:MAG: galactokinase [Chitinophagaceae bacterium]
MIHSGTDILKIFPSIFPGNPALYFAPGRINLLGEHIDYNAGYVMPAAIEQGFWFAIGKGNENEYSVYSATLNEYVNGNFSSLSKSTGWKNYILGVIDQFIKKGFSLKGFNAVFGGDLPVGSGLSSSAALECGLAVALNDFNTFNIPKKEIALMCQHAEQTFPGMQCGIMDQYASMFGEKDNILFLDCIHIESEKIKFPSSTHAIVLINSNVKHALEDGSYNTRRNQSEEGLLILQKRFPQIYNFRDATIEQLSMVRKDMQTDIFKRCKFIIEEIERTKMGATFLKEGNISAFGKCMYASHAGLRDLYNVSCPELDFLVEESSKNESVTGARLMGGGFGGCTINLMEHLHAAEIAEYISFKYFEKFNTKATVYIVEPGDGARCLKV